MIRRVFVDCDVILDLLLARHPFFDSATRLFELLESEDLEGHASPLVFSNLFYILRRQITPEAARNALQKLKRLLRLLPVDEKTVDLALASSFTDLEDALQYYTALAHDLDALVSRNKRHYRAARIPVLTAEECVAIVSAQRERQGSPEV